MRTRKREKNERGGSLSALVAMLLPWCNSSKVALGAPGFDSFSSLLSIPMSTATLRLFLSPGTRREKKARAQVSEQSNRPKAAGPRPATRPWPATTCVAAFRVFPRGQQDKERHFDRFSDPLPTTTKGFQGFDCKRGRNAAREKSGIRRERGPSLVWQLASNLVLFVQFFLSPFSSPKRKRTTARHASTQSAKDARTRDISCHEKSDRKSE